MGYNERYYDCEPCASCSCVCGACDDDGCLSVVCVCGDDEPHQGWARFFCDSILVAHGQGVQVLRGVADGGFDGEVIFKDDSRPHIAYGGGGQGVMAQRGYPIFDGRIPRVEPGSGNKGVAAQRGGQSAKFDERRPAVLARHSGGQGVTAQRGV